jgi:FMN-dependent oxidoreductase (nitrilotriacetate monooxygenase family)
MSAQRKMKFAVFLMADSNYHIAGWRHPASYVDAGSNLQRWIEFARTMERGKLDMLFVADVIGVPGVRDPDYLSHTPTIDKFEPFTLLAALSTVTQRIGLVATSATEFNQPYWVARTLASLDHLSGGRAGWNLVTGGNAEDAANFSQVAHAEHGDRYERAEEFIDVVRGLWDSYDADAFPRDKASGRYFNPDRMHVLEHVGKFYSVKGPLSVSRLPQVRPVVVQAGMSEPARRLSARVADIVFTAQSSIDDARIFYADVKGRMAQFGRRPDDLKIMPGVAMYIGRSENEAQEKVEQLNALIPIHIALARLSRMLGGVDLSNYSIDEPMPEIAGNAARVSTPLNYVRLARRDGLTLRQVAMRSAIAKDHWALVGTPAQIADRLEEWFVTGAADGFNILPPMVPGSINDFVDLVVPELQRRSLFRTEYEGTMLRENLGLPTLSDNSVRVRLAK